MSKIFQTVPWLVAGAALFHLGQKFLQEREEQINVLKARRQTQLQAKTRRLYQLVTACQRGTLNHN